MQSSEVKTTSVTEDATRTYLDFAAATPVRKEVLEVMIPYFTKTYGNPSSIHAEGVSAHEALEDARAEVSDLLGVRDDGIVFTSGGTEANNIAIHGVIEARHHSGLSYAEMEVITTAIEHPSITRTLEALTERGVTVRTMPVTEEGRIDEIALEALLSPRTVLVAYAYVNSEVGVIQPVRRIARVISKFAAAHDVEIVHHLDACQAPLWLPCKLEQLGVDTLALDGGKCYGPKGIGAIAKRHSSALLPTLFGGDQEGGLRPGTENLPGIVGFAKALSIAVKGHEDRAHQVAALRDTCISDIEREIPEVLLNGSKLERVANNINVSIPGIDSEFMVIVLDHAGFAVGARSACSGKKGGGSEVVRAMTGDEARATSTLRITLGEETTKGSLKQFVEALRLHVEKTRRAAEDFQMTT